MFTKKDDRGRLEKLNVGNEISTEVDSLMC